MVCPWRDLSLLSQAAEEHARRVELPRDSIVLSSSPPVKGRIKTLVTSTLLWPSASQRSPPALVACRRSSQRRHPGYPSGNARWRAAQITSLLRVCPFFGLSRAPPITLPRQNPSALAWH